MSPMVFVRLLDYGTQEWKILAVHHSHICPKVANSCYIPSEE
jgi:hypothetical protein